MTPTHTQLEVSRTIRADRESVFDAWTDPAKIVEWWGAGGVTCPEAEMNVAAGGTYRIANLTPSVQTMWIKTCITSKGHLDSIFTPCGSKYILRWHSFKFIPYIGQYIDHCVETCHHCSKHIYFGEEQSGS